MFPLIKSTNPPHGLPVLAIGPKGGKIVGYRHGDMKRPIYAGTAAAAKLATEQGHKGEAAKKHAGKFGVVELLESLSVYYGIKVAELGNGSFSLVSSSPHALAAAKAAFGGKSVSFGSPFKLPNSEGKWAAAIVVKGDDIIDHALETKAGKPALAVTGKATAGWPADTPAPGTVISRAIGDHTYTLHVVDAGGKPKWLVTAPAGAPLFVFGAGGHGVVKGSITGSDSPITLAF